MLCLGALLLIRNSFYDSLINSFDVHLYLELTHLNEDTLFLHFIWGHRNNYSIRRTWKERCHLIVCKILCCVIPYLNRAMASKITSWKKFYITYLFFLLVHIFCSHLCVVLYSLIILTFIYYHTHTYKKWFFLITPKWHSFYTKKTIASQKKYPTNKNNAKSGTKLSELVSIANAKWCNKGVTNLSYYIKLYIISLDLKLLKSLPPREGWVSNLYSYVGWFISRTVILNAGIPRGSVLFCFFILTTCV